MSRYIDADKLKDNFCGACATPKRYQRTFEQCQNHRDTYGNRCFKMRLIDTTPTADVEEVRHGEWITPKSRDADDWLECSRCGYCFDISVGHMPTPYCPECGAKMDGGRREKCEID